LVVFNIYVIYANIWFGLSKHFSYLWWLWWLSYHSH